MRKFARIGSVLLLALVAAAAPGEPAAQTVIGQAQKVVRKVSGTYQDNIRKLSLKDTVYSRERVDTGPASATRLIFLDKTILSVGPDSKVVLDRFVFDPNPAKSEVTLSISKGVLRFVTGNLPKSKYLIKTPNASIGVRGTTVEVTVDDAGNTTIKVLQGTAIINAGGKSQVVNAGQQLTIPFDGPPGSPVATSSASPGQTAAMNTLLGPDPVGQDGVATTGGRSDDGIARITRDTDFTPPPTPPKPPHTWVGVPGTGTGTYETDRFYDTYYTHPAADAFEWWTSTCAAQPLYGEYKLRILLECKDLPPPYDLICAAGIVRDALKGDPDNVCRHHASMMVEAAQLLDYEATFEAGWDGWVGHAWAEVEAGGKKYVIDAFSDQYYSMDGPPPPYCGNNTKEEGEACDGRDNPCGEDVACEACECAPSDADEQADGSIGWMPGSGERYGGALAGNPDIRIKVGEVHHRTGDNFTDPDYDPEEEEANDSGDTVSSPNSGSGSGGGSGGSGGSSGMFDSLAGSLSGDGGCGVSSSTLTVSGNDVFMTVSPNGTVTFAGAGSGGSGTSSSTNLTIFGAAGHTCTIGSISGNTFNFSCTDGKSSCSETMTK